MLKGRGSAAVIVVIAAVAGAMAGVVTGLMQPPPRPEPTLVSACRSDKHGAPFHAKLVRLLGDPMSMSPLSYAYPDGEGGALVWLPERRTTDNGWYLVRLPEWRILAYADGLDSVFWLSGGEAVGLRLTPRPLATLPVANMLTEPLGIKCYLLDWRSGGMERMDFGSIPQDVRPVISYAASNWRETLRQGTKSYVWGVTARARYLSETARWKGRSAKFFVDETRGGTVTVADRKRFVSAIYNLPPLSPAVRAQVLEAGKLAGFIDGGPDPKILLVTDDRGVEISYRCPDNWNASDVSVVWISNDEILLIDRLGREGPMPLHVRLSTAIFTPLVPPGVEPKEPEARHIDQVLAEQALRRARQPDAPLQ